MAKLVFYAAIVVAAFLFMGFAQASTKYTITTTVDEEDGGSNQGGGGQMRKCDQQMQQMIPEIRHCQEYLSSQMQQQQGQGQMPSQQHLRQCCMTLENMPEMCRCKAVRMAVWMCHGQQPGGMQQEGMEEMMRAARFLPQQCNMGPHECRI